MFRVEIYTAILVVLIKMAASMDNEVHEKYLTMPRQEFIEYFNNQNFSWQITDYNQTFRYGHAGRSILNSSHFDRVEEIVKDLPKNFDSRSKWPNCITIQEIYNQGSCGSCWTFGTANTASDRTCIHKGITVHLAEQDLQCQNDNVCGGGFPDAAFMFWKESGLVSRECKPYDIEKLLRGSCELTCVNETISYANDKHFAERVYKVSAEREAVKSELFTNGPIQASFVVFEDFEQYHSGIYEHKYGETLGGHSVRVIGYGEENGIEFWLVANSWGTSWGENGYFRIKIGQDLIEFENDMISGIPRN